MPDSTWGNAQAIQNLHEAAQRFLGTIGHAEGVGSGDHLLRVTAGGTDYVVRQWAANAGVNRIDLAARALNLAATRNVELLPKPHSLQDEPDTWALRIGDRYMTAATWLPGRPLARYGDYRTPDGDVIDVPLPSSAPAETIVLDAVRTIGRFHAATIELAENVPGGKSTLVRLLNDSRNTWNEQRRTIGQSAANSPEIRRWLRCGNRIMPVAAELLETLDASGAGSTIIHGDIWPANLLIEGNASDRTLSGIVGWSSVAIGSPLIDLAHLAIHTSGWSGALAENILGAYTEVANLSPGERRLLPVVAALDLVPRVGRLLELAYIDDRMIGHEAQPILRSGLKSLLVSLENLTQVLAPDAEWDQRKAIEARKTREGLPIRRFGGEERKPGRQSGSGRSRPASRREKPKAG
jgi:Ser/Thr protein kinase RdoA (MazF antagonist)